jgi:hypothetical protein
MNISSAQAQSLRQSLLRHLMQYPQAADTVAGIREWWLPDLMDPVELEDLRTVLLELVSERVIALRRLPDGTELFAGSSHPATPHLP